MNFRKVLFWLHLVVGVVAGLVILTMAVTGIAYTYQKQIITSADRRIAKITPPSADAQPLGLEELATKVAAALPEERPTAFTLRSDPQDPVVVNFGRDRVMLADPFTGAVVGETTKWRAFLKQVEQVHRNLALGPDGKKITGPACISFFVLLLSGLYLWFPRRWNKAAVKAATVPSLKLRGKARHWNWHNAFGFWAALPLLVTILTGMVMSFEWANNLLFRLTGNEPPAPRAAPAAPGAPGAPRRGEGGRGEGQGEGRSTGFQAKGFKEMWTVAVEKVPTWQMATLRLGEGPAAPVTLTMDEATGHRPDLRTQFSFKRGTGELVKSEPYESHNLGRQLRLWTKPVHTGEAWGLFGQTLSVLASLAAVILVWTGFALAWRRFRQRKKKGGAPAASLEPAPEAAISSPPTNREGIAQS